jgi:hypothetical protein
MKLASFVVAFRKQAGSCGGQEEPEYEQAHRMVLASFREHPRIAQLKLRVSPQPGQGRPVPAFIQQIRTPLPSGGDRIASSIPTKRAKTVYLFSTDRLRFSGLCSQSPTKRRSENLAWEGFITPVL